MRKGWWSAIAIACLGVSGCGAGVARRGPADPAVDARDPLSSLSASGPDGFAMVSPRLYRGGAPSPDDLVRLRELGVTRIVDLRRGSLGRRNAERAAAAELGLQYLEYPFYGIFGVEPTFLDALLAELSREDGGAVYVHCGNGRGRTSLAVALYRVVEEGWAPEVAWEREALAYGHRPSRANRELALTFDDYVQEHTTRKGTGVAALARRRRIADRTADPASPGTAVP